MTAYYVYCTDQSKADALQAAFLRLSYADDDPNKPATWFSEVHNQNDPAQVRVCIKDDDRFFIRVDGPPDVFDALLQPYIDGGMMPQSDLDQIHERIRVFSGTGVGIYIYNMLPQIIRGLSWTRQDLIDNGWIDQDGE